MAETFAKKDAKKQRVFGFAYVHTAAGKPVVDHSGETVDTEVAKADFEEAVYEHCRTFRATNELHVGADAETQIESFWVTKEKLMAIGVPADALDNVIEGWWRGDQFDDPEVWKKVEDGTYSMYSIEGTGARTPIADED